MTRRLRNRKGSSKLDRASDLTNRARELALEGGTAGLQALRLLKVAAKQGDQEANYALGTWYLFGKNVPKDLAKAGRYLRKAASSGYVAAMFDLAILYERGRGVQRDKSKAFDLYLCAARKGDIQAIASVGRCLYHGLGVARHTQLGNLVLDYADTLERLRK